MKMVVKVGGSLADEGLEKSIMNVYAAAKDNQVVIVHGGGPQISALSEKLGKKPVYVTAASGFKSRYTDQETRDIAVMAMVGNVNKRIVSLLNSRGISAVGISGADGPTLIARRKDKLIVQEGNKKRVLKGDYSGKIDEVNGSLVSLLISLGYVPVVAPIAISSDGELVNVDGDRAAAYIAKAINADVLVSVTDVPGLILNGKVVRRLTIKEAEELVSQLEGGMKKKVFAALEALKIGVPAVVICSGLMENSVASAAKMECGTVITR
ncbi:MAG: [LysW]-aminoadipate/[LysW]-glutamate kinase [Candidatus Freyarchaeota archaeon]|nr:[LysW]-aminoadipate/[LysW]-glutamate kinase [Candidatus Jordarchaeia archaeon]